MMLLTFVILILKSLQAQSQFSDVTEAIISDMYRTSYFTSGHEAVFEVDVTTNQTRNIYEQFYGLHDREHNYPMSRSSQFRVGSNSKSFTSIAIMQLHESGKLDIDADIKGYLTADDLKTLGYNRSGDYCPILYDANTNTLGTTCQKITFRNLLSMQSGIINSITCTYQPNQWQRKYCQPAYVGSWWYGSTADIIKFFINSPLEYAPGTTYSYTNENQLFLSYFIEKISGKKLEIYLKEKIFDPLGMKNTFLDSLDGELSARTNLVSGYWDYTDLSTRTTSYFAYGKIQSTEGIQGVLSGSGGVASTVWDMAKFYSSMFATKNQTLLQPSSVDLLIKATGVTGDTASFGYCSAWGLGFFLYYNPCTDTANKPSCSTECVNKWKNTDRIAVFYEGVIKAFTFSTLYGENWTHTSGSRYISVATRNNIVVNVTEQKHKDAVEAMNGTIASLTQGWGQTGLSIMNCMFNWVTAYTTGFHSTTVGGFKALSNTAPQDAGTSTSCSSSESSNMSDGEIAAAVILPTFTVCAVIIAYLHYFLRPTIIQSSAHKNAGDVANPVRGSQTL